jgi:hypothetical protein
LIQHLVIIPSAICNTPNACNQDRKDGIEVYKDKSIPAVIKFVKHGKGCPGLDMKPFYCDFGNQPVQKIVIWLGNRFCKFKGIERERKTIKKQIGKKNPEQEFLCGIPLDAGVDRGIHGNFFKPLSPNAVFLFFYQTRSP